MDQDSFRLLLQTRKPVSPSGRASSTTKPKTIPASQPAFKPRKVKKESESRYRDRAAERRHGEGNDYAEVEAVFEEFERRNADNADKDEVEQKRKYLGGDSQHSILVKGLDVALLEANKAKAAISTEDDDILEKAFAGQELISPPESNLIPKKRTREELVRELKEKRGQIQSTDNDTTLRSAEEEAKLLEEAKKAGKFKPIGFKPIAEEKSKKNKVKGEAKDGERKKKKRKVGEGEGQNSMIAKNVGNETLPPDANKLPALPKPEVTASASEPAVPEPEPLPEDFNIFADAGEYECLDLGEEEEEDSAQRIDKENSTVDEPSSAIPRRWIPMDEEDLPVEPPHNEPSTSKSRLPPLESCPRSPERNTIPYPPEETGIEEEEQSTRLRPLESSALPSIKDFLAMQEAADAEEKRKKRKEKKKAKANK